MLTAADIMTPDPISIAPNSTLRDAVELLSRFGISGMPVVDGRCLVGTLSANDIIDFEATTRGVPAGRDNDGVDDVEPEVERSMPDFYANMWEDAGVDVVERMESADVPEWDFLSQHLVSEAMSDDTRTFAAYDSVDDIADHLRDSEAHCALIANGGAIVGVVTTMDITRAVAQHRAST